MTSRYEALKLLEVMTYGGADSREEALGIIERMRNPESFLTEGPKVESAKNNALRNFGGLLNTYGNSVRNEVGPIESIFTAKTRGSYLRLERDVELPHVNTGTYHADVIIENNPREVEGSGKPLWREGELLSITIKSKEFPTPDDNYTYEIIIDRKNGGVAYINGGGPAPLDLGDYEILGYLFEDIDR